MRRMSRETQLLFWVLLLGALGGVIIAAPSWASLLTPQGFGGMMLSVASTLAAAYHIPMPPKNGKPFYTGPDRRSRTNPQIVRPKRTRRRTDILPPNTL